MPKTKGRDYRLLLSEIDAEAMGTALVEDFSRRVRASLGADCPVQLFALGGVTRGRAADCLQAGADGVAAIRADLIAGLPAFDRR